MESNSIKSIFQGLTLILVFHLLASILLLLSVLSSSSSSSIMVTSFSSPSPSSSSLSSSLSYEEKQKIELNKMKILSRKRRFLAFPFGSSFSATICTTIGMYGNPNYNWISFALNMGVSYNLPNETWVVDAAHGFGNLKLIDDTSSKPNGAEIIEKRRTRRDLYHRIQTVIDRMGFDGKQCVLRALCESAKLFSKLKGTMVEEMIKTIFSYPGRRLYSKEELIDFERYNDYTYQRAFQKGSKTNYVEKCLEFYPNCSFSLIDLAFGKYSVRPTTLVKKEDFLNL